VMPSRVNLNEAHEGFGLAFLEAAACGIPGIGSNVGGIPDAVVDGETGKLVEPDSPEELANAILFFYERAEKRKQMGRAARERARKQFSPQFIGSYFYREISLRSTMNSMRTDASTAEGSGSFGVDFM
jgi:glycosyltransferase involved in cell wall biosynthesis